MDFQDITKRFFRHNFAVLGLVLTLLMILLAVLGPALTSYPYDRMDPANVLTGPSLRHWLGTDDFGRDVLSRIAFGARISLWVGFLGVLSSTFVGAIFGLIAGYFGRYIDDIIMRVMDIFMSFPSILLALFVVGVLGSNLNNVIIAISIAYVPFFARITRAEVVSIRQKQFIEAAISIGAPQRRIMIRHVFPSAFPSLLIQATINLAYMILIEASLSYLGLGTQPPTPSWGRMLTEARPYMLEAPHLSIFPGFAVLLTVIGFSLLGDGLRDVLDPRLRGAN